MGIRADFSACGFFDRDVWFRGVPDYLHINSAGTTARVADYKTGKSSRYADPGQLELMAGMIMAHYPNVQRVKGALLFVVANDIVKCEFTRAQFPEIMSKWAGRAGQIETAVEVGVWNPRRGPLCGFCPVSSCDHHPG
jgi:putative RecB family exonuclease